MQDVKQAKQLKRREMILNGNLWKTSLIIALPIMLYNLCNYFYGIYDMMIVQNANIGEAADIVVLDQIKNMISTLGGSLATGGGILISRRYGEKKLTEARRAANALFSIALIVAGLTLLLIPIGVPFLRLLKTSETTINNAMGYFYVQIITLFVTTINNAFISLEKSKGNTLKLLILNLLVITTKLSLTTLFAFGPFEGVTITWLAVATLIAQSIMLIFGLIFTFLPSNILRVTPKELNLNKVDTLSIIKLALPIFIGGFLFNYGKVYINGEATETYGDMCVGALGISNTIAGLLSNIINSFQDSGATIVSQNYGNSNGRRIKKFFKINTVYILTLSILGTIILYLLKGNIAEFFAPNDELYQEMIINIFKWECLDILFMGLGALAYTIFYGFGLTKVTMAMSMSTLFVFRIPILLLLIHVIKMDYEACGIAMFASNTAIGTIGLAMVLIFLHRIPKKQKYQYLFSN